MKKLMIAAAIVCAAVAAQASSFDWKTSMSGKLYNENTTDTYTGLGGLEGFERPRTSVRGRSFCANRSPVCHPHRRLKNREKRSDLLSRFLRRFHLSTFPLFHF